MSINSRPHRLWQRQQLWDRGPNHQGRPQIGVLDVDSPSLDRFNDNEAELTEFVAILTYID